MENNDYTLVIEKIPLKEFIDALVGIYEQGVNFIDLEGSNTDGQSSLGILFSKDYIENDDDAPSEQINIPLSDDNLNELI